MPAIETNPFQILSQQLSELKEQIAAFGVANQKAIEIIDRDELMKRLKITEPTVIRWTKRSRIPEMRIGSSVRYNWPAVVQALETQLEPA